MDPEFIRQIKIILILLVLVGSGAIFVIPVIIGYIIEGLHDLLKRKKGK